MRSELTINRKIKSLEKSANKYLSENMRLRKLNDPSAGAFLRAYNMSCERVYTLKWALGESKEI